MVILLKTPRKDH